jgi:DNA-binding beta-propeller fold protein YncE
VQEAIDQMCAQRDLRHHNKHLHGWGIVCGLQVHCGDDDIDVPGDRATVTVRPGYALDCEGNDIVLDEDMSVNVLELIRAYEAENPNMPLIIDGEGDVCLVVGRDERGDPVVELRPYDPNRNNLQSLLKDTFWMDVFQDCIQEPLNQLREILFPDNDDGNNIPVTPARRQLIALLNLVIQFFNPQYGSHVFISRKEDAILRLVYQVLRALLQSHTFCAMFDNARPFPEYPFGRDLQMSTIFDLTLRTRLRVHPNGRLGFAVGYDDRIHVYNLEEEELIAQLDMPGGTGLVARDVAFSQDGNQIYAVGTLRDEDSILAPGKVTERGEVEWEDIHIICEGLLVTMVRMPDSENTLLAVAEGRGLYIINPDNVIPNAEPNVAFNASGHLVVDGRGQRAYASANSDENNVFAETFDRVHEISWETQEILRTFRLPQAFTGMDDIAIMPASGRTPATLYAVAQTQQNEKQILAYRGSEDMPFAMIATLGDTTLRLQPIPNQPLMAVTYEDYYLLSLVDTVRQTTTEYQLPVQISPIGMAVSSELEMLYVVNGLSQTINNIGLRHLVPNADGDLPPGSPQFIEAMRRYRADVIAAYLDLAGGLLQWLKDCICDHLLVNCPTCDDEDEIYLGCVSIRGGEVYKVCNFSQRKYVHSFPTVEYWMSMIPILPLVDYAVEQVCCLVLPDLFGRFQVPGQDANRGSSFQGKQARSGFGYYKAGTLGTDVQGILGRVTIGRGLTGDWLGSRIQKATVSPSFGQKTRVLGSRDLYNKPVAEATRRAELANVTVAGVEKYDASLGLKNLVEVGKMPASLPAGESIKLYERDGVVRYFSVVKTPTVGRIATASATADVATLQSKISAMETELAELRAFRDEVRSFMASQDNGK